MEMQEPWLTCRVGKKLFLLARDATAYYIIEVNKRLDYATEEWLMQQGVSEELLKELLLAFEYIPQSALRGVAIGGCTAGDAVYLYMESAKRKLTLEMDYDEDWMEGFFRDIPRFIPPADKKDKEKAEKNWRKEQQDPKLYDKFRYVVPVLTILNMLFSIGYVIQGAGLWYLGCMLCMGAALVLDIVFPAYFTLIPSKKGKKSDAWELEWIFIVHLFVYAVLPLRNWLDEGLVIKVWVAGGVGCALIMGFFAKEFRGKWLSLLVIAFVGGLLCMAMAGHANEAFAYAKPETYVLEVEDLHSSGRRNRNYYCTVTLPDGRQVELDITRSLYMELTIGDRVMIEHGIGALGIEYANAYQLD